MIPGRVLHRLATYVCSAKSLEHVVEPAIADLQKECTESSGRVFRGGWLLLVGYLAVWRVMILSISEIASTSEDKTALVRAAFVAGASMIAITLVLMIPPVVGRLALISPVHIALIIPQAVPLAIPLGLVLGLAFGVSGRVVSGGAARTMLLAALLCSVVSFATLVWLMPASNQEFRQQVSTAMGNRGAVSKGFNEMTFRELEREIAIAKAIGNDRGARSTAWYYHLKGSLASTPFVLALLALSTARRGRALPRTFILLSPVAYWLLMLTGESLAIGTPTPPSLGAWLPNIVFAAIAIAIASSGVSRFRDSMAGTP